MMMRDVMNPLAVWGAGCVLLLLAVHRHEPQAPRVLRSVYASLGTEHPEVLGAIEASDLLAARGRIGTQSAFTGTVSALYAAPDGSVRLLNFHPDYRQAIVAAVKPADYSRLGGLVGLERLVGQRVLVRGRFFLFKERPEVELASPGQIKLVR